MMPAMTPSTCSSASAKVLPRSKTWLGWRTRSACLGGRTGTSPPRSCASSCRPTRSAGSIWPPASAIDGGLMARTTPRPPTRTERGPAVLIVGGLLTSPWFYRAMRRPLVARGASHVAIAPLFGAHWLASAFIGLGPATSIVARAIEQSSDDDGGGPILVVGHSGGGILVRLATAQRSFDGALRARPGAVGALVPLGTPPLAVRVDGTLGRQGMRALRFLARYGSPAGGSAGPAV